MPKARPHKPESCDATIKDEPGAEERFKGILKRALSTPPAHKQKAKQEKPKKR